MICFIANETFTSEVERCSELLNILFSEWASCLTYGFRIHAMKTYTLNETDCAALAVLRSTGADVLEAALVAKTALDAGRGRTKRAMRCIAAGAEALRQQERTVTFEKAVEAALEARKDRRTRTVYDFRYFTRRFMKRCPGLAKRRVRAMTPQECAGYIEQAFDTPRQRQKARLILSGVFGTAV